MLNLWLAPWRASLALTSASLDTMLAMQKSAMSFSAISLSDGFDSTDETYLRETFHLAADANLRRWSEAAGMLQAMPEWYQKAASGPGSALTDLFDKARRMQG